MEEIYANRRYQKALARIRELEGLVTKLGHQAKEAERNEAMVAFVEEVAKSKSKFGSKARQLLEL